jgi:hypothetical protein
LFSLDLVERRIFYEGEVPVEVVVSNFLVVF